MFQEIKPEKTREAVLFERFLLIAGGVFVIGGIILAAIWLSIG